MDDVLALLQRGYLPYSGHVTGEAYAALGCGPRRRPRWFYLVADADQRFVCVGCSKRCSLVNPAGFELMLPVTMRTKSLTFAHLPAVSAEELLRKKVLLTVREVEFILSISARTIYALLDEGRLDRHPDPPTRITAESVRREVDRWKED
jgi:predicted DNA-binding transcriptional regulator AlpA